MVFTDDNYADGFSQGQRPGANAGFTDGYGDGLLIQVDLDAVTAVAKKLAKHSRRMKELSGRLFAVSGVLDECPGAPARERAFRRLMDRAATQTSKSSARVTTLVQSLKEADSSFPGVGLPQSSVDAVADRVMTLDDAQLRTAMKEMIDEARAVDPTIPPVDGYRFDWSLLVGGPSAVGLIDQLIPAHSQFQEMRARYNMATFNAQLAQFKRSKNPAAAKKYIMETLLLDERQASRIRQQLWKRIPGLTVDEFYSEVMIGGRPPFTVSERVAAVTMLNFGAGVDGASAAARANAARVVYRDLPRAMKARIPVTRFLNIADRLLLPVAVVLDAKSVASGDTRDVVVGSIGLVASGVAIAQLAGVTASIGGVSLLGGPVAWVIAAGAIIVAAGDAVLDYYEAKAEAEGFEDAYRYRYLEQYELGYMTGLDASIEASINGTAIACEPSQFNINLTEATAPGEAGPRLNNDLGAAIVQFTDRFESQASLAERPGGPTAVTPYASTFGFTSVIEQAEVEASAMQLAEDARLQATYGDASVWHTGVDW